MVRDVYSAFKVPIAMATTEKEQKDDAPSFIDELPKVGPPEGEADLVRWKGFWVMPEIVEAVISIESQFHPLPSDIILASFPKTGTTWLKALTITLLNYHNIKQDFNLQIFNPLQQQKQGLSPKVDDPLLTKNPHQIVPFLELECFGDDSKFDRDTMKSSPRVFNTHLSYSMLPDNVKKSGCKLVYIARNPMDTFVSWWHFFHNKPSSDITMNQSFDQFCRGVVRGGPYFDHVLGYWRVSEENKDGMLFLTYEELKVDYCKHVKRLADFLGCFLNPDEIEQVVGKCSFERVSNLGVNKKDKSKLHWTGLDFSTLFRRVVDDYQNYLTHDKVEQLQKVVREKWSGTGLTSWFSALSDHVSKAPAHREVKGFEAQSSC